MRKYLLPCILISGLGLAGATAQTFVRALQLSQDTSGAFAVDSNNGVYFPGHILTTGLAPTPTLCGTGSPAIVGTDFAGTLTEGTSAATCSIGFSRAYVTAPYCVVVPQTPTNAVTYTITTTGIVMTHTSQSGVKINYMCSGAS